MLYYEDIEVGVVRRFGSKQVTREEVIDFAAKYDPQPFHLDDEAAANTHFRRIGERLAHRIDGDADDGRQYEGA